MATRCTKCGTFLTDGERFCPNCGENAPQPIAQTSAPAQQVPLYGQNGSPLPPPIRTAAQNTVPNTEEMTIAKWVTTLIVTTFLGVISWIFLFIWGFGSGPKARQDYCKAALIVKAISLVLAILIGSVYASFLIPWLAEVIRESDYYETAAFVSRFFV